MFFEQIQIIKENDTPKFAVIDYSEFQNIRELLLDEEKLEDYLDYLHMQNVKSESKEMLTFDDVKKQLFDKKREN